MCNEYQPVDLPKLREAGHKSFDEGVLALGKIKGKLRLTTELEDGRMFSLGAYIDSDPIMNLRRGWDLLGAFEYTVKRELAKALARDNADADSI